MEQVLEVLLVLLVIAGGLVLLLTSAVFFVVYKAAQCARRMQMELPWLTWLTLEDVVKMGYSQTWAPIALSALYEKGNLEARIRDNLTSSQERLVRSSGFKTYTVDWHEFQLTKRGGRRKRFSFPRLPKLQEAWKPASA